LGHIGPFQGAIALTVVALFIILFTWDENYGENNPSSATPQTGNDSSATMTNTEVSILDGWKLAISDNNIWRIGLIQALSEGAMYTFVFMWVPSLLSLNLDGGVPTGCVFSALMMSITIGGILYPMFHDIIKKVTKLTSNSAINHDEESKSIEICATLVYLLASASMAVPVACLSIGAEDRLSTLYPYCTMMIVSSFLVVEACVGMFMPVAGTLRSKYVPDNVQGAILNIFRLPLNAIVVAGTYATDHYSRSTVFTLVSSCFFAASLLQATMIITTGKSISLSVDRSKKTD
jgi:MFS transporter, MFS domain-containing protein family, molybdate-anion transporter